MSSSINLLNQRNKIQPDNTASSKQKLLRTIAVSLLFIVSISAMIFFILVAFSPLPQLRQKEEEVSFKLAQSSDDIIKLALVKERTDNIQEFIDKRSNYQSILSAFKVDLPSSVLIDEVNIDKANFIVTFSSNSLLRIEEFLNSLAEKSKNEKSFSSLEVLTVSTDKEKRNNFLLTVKVGRP